MPHRHAIATVFLAIALGDQSAMASEPDELFDDRPVVALELLEGAFDRTRRSVVLGPSVGLAETVSLNGGDLAVRASFGLSLLRFDIPVLPTTDSIMRVLRSQATERFLAAIANRGPMSETERSNLAEQIWREIIDEFLLKYRPKRFERPGWALRLNGRYLATDGAGTWEVGFSVGLGVGPVFISAGETVQVNNGAGLSTGLELSVPMTLSRGLRSPSVEFFVRASLANTSREDRVDRLMLGVRAMLDII